MFTIDEIRIEGEEDGFHLVIYLDGYPDESVRYRIGLPDQFDAEVRRTIGSWLAEGEAARAFPGFVPGSPVHVPSPIVIGDISAAIEALDDPDLARDIERGK